MKRICEKIKEAENIALFCHINADGDAIGSIFALKDTFQLQGKKATVFIDDKIPDRLSFLADEHLTEFKDLGFDLYFALDCGESSRLGIYEQVFLNAKNSIVVDHHFSNEGFGGVCYVDGNASSTGEVLCTLFDELNYDISKKSATLLYASISSDTGCFQYSNTTAKTHDTVKTLINKGAEIFDVNKRLFDTLPIKEARLNGYAMSNIELYCEDKVAVVMIKQADLDRLGCVYEDAEGLSGLPRSIEGVEIGLLVKEWKENKIKISVRTNYYIDASDLASNFGGGGHKRAAGCVIEGDIESAKEKIIAQAEKMLKG